ncbi:MAG: hypothetical protein KC646_03875 [Candidatus Cloacimonetes bacterium]|nr:hypothetical protein [Candidatus Cloacimonadota bacterium]
MKNVFDRFCKFAICSSLALSISTVSWAAPSEEDLVEAIRNCVDPTINQCDQVKQVRDELRGIREDGSYEYFQFEKKGNRSKDNNENLDTDEGMYTVKLQGGSQAMYKVVFHLPKSRGVGKDNTLMRLDSYEITYTPVANGNGPQNIVVIKENPEQDMSLGEEITILLENVGTEVSVQAKVYAQESKRSWGLNPDPNFEIKLFKSSQVDDPSNPDAQLVQYAKSATRSTLKKMGVPFYEVPPANVVIYDTRFENQKAMYRAQDVIDRAANAGNAMRAIGILEGSAIHGPSSIISALNTAIKYLSAGDKYHSELAKSYGQRILDQVNRLSNRFTFYTDQEAGYDDLKDGYGDSDTKPGYGGGYDSDTKPGYGSDTKPGYGSGYDSDTKPGYGNDKPSDTKPGYGNDKPSDTKPGYGNGGSYNSSTKSFDSLFGMRKYDTVRGSTAIDNKNGRLSNSEALRTQIKKDRDIMSNRQNGINSVEWHFFPKSGKVGPTDTLRDALNRAGIRIVIKNGGAGYDSDTKSDYKSGGSFYDSDLK